MSEDTSLPKLLNVKPLSDVYELHEFEGGLKRIYCVHDSSYGIRGIDDYQGLALRTAMDEARTDPMYSAAGLCGESGEYIEMIKHERYHKHLAQPERKCKELGDVGWYLATASGVQGLALSEVLEQNIIKLATRYPEGFDFDKSRERLDGEPLDD